MDVVGAMTVMRVLLFVLHVCMLNECEGDGNACVWGWMKCGCGESSAVHVGDTRDSGIVASGPDVLWIGVVRGMRGVGEVCEMYMCLARGGAGAEGSEWMTGLVLCFTYPLRTGVVLDVCLCLG